MSIFKQVWWFFTDVQVEHDKDSVRIKMGAGPILLLILLIVGSTILCMMTTIGAHSVPTNIL